MTLPELWRTRAATFLQQAKCAAAESAALCSALPDVKVTAWVGACERTEFLHQSALLVEDWRRQGVPIEPVTDP